MSSAAYADNTRPGLAYSITFGGHGSDIGVATATDSSGNVYVVGNTTSTDFPVKNAFQPRIGGTPLRYSTDTGKTWSAAGLTAAVTAVGGSAAAPGLVYAASNSTIYKSSDSGKTWTALNVTANQVTTILADPVTPATVYVATGAGVLKSADAGATWVLENAVDGEAAWALAMNPAQPSTLMASFNPAPYPSPGYALVPNVYRSTDGGVTWALLANSPVAVAALACDPSNPNVWYAAGRDPSSLGGSSVYKTADNGATWSRLTDAGGRGGTVSLAVGSTAIYVATLNGVILSRDGGVTWTATSLGAEVTALALDPNNPQTLYAAAGSIYASVDGGTTWTTALGVRQNVQTLAVLPSTPSTVFVGDATGQNLFVTKWSPDGRTMLYSTYLGGSYLDFAKAIAVDGLGNAYVTGYTYSNDFPLSSGALQTKTSAVYTPFVAKIGPDGGTLEYSTYLGGSMQDAAFAIAVDAGGSAYLTGFAGSTDFPTSPGALRRQSAAGCSPPSADYEATYSPGSAFAAKLSPDGATLLYSAIAGGSCGEQGQGIAVDSAGNAYVAGTTLSTDFPVTGGSLQSTTESGVSTGFLMKLSPQGALLSSTLIGGPFGSTANAVALDGSGSAYLTGCTSGFDDERFFGGYDEAGEENEVSALLTSPLSLPPGIAATCYGAAYALKLNAADSARTYLMYIGESYGAGYAIAVDGSGRAWISGYQSQTDNSDAPFPLVHPFQAWTSPGFVSEISADGTTLLFSSNADPTGSIALDASGNAFLAGGAATASDVYPFGLNSAVELLRIDAAVPGAVTVEAPQQLTVASVSYSNQGVAPGETIALTGTGLGPAQAVGPQVTAGQVATSLAGTTVTFDGVPAPLLSVAAGRILCVVPFAVGSVNPVTAMQVSSGGAASNGILLPAYSTMAEVLAVVNQDGTVNSAGHPAPAGSVVTIYASGFGQTVPPSVDGQVNGTGMLQPVEGDVMVQIVQANEYAEILYAGLAPGQVAGVFQINVVLPQLDPGSYQTAVGVEYISGGSSSTTGSSTTSSVPDQFAIFNLVVSQ